MHPEPPSASSSLPRRKFAQSITLATAALGGLTPRMVSAADSRPAVLGGQPTVEGSFSDWPITDASEHKMLGEVIDSGAWYRYNSGKTVSEFERRWAADNNSPFCQATSSGTAALITALGAMGIAPGDEVLMSPYTFIATVNSVLLFHALPVFVDTDPETAQIDVGRIEEKINGATRYLMPVHLGGASCDIEALLSIADRHGLQVLEDSCQSHTGEWRGQRLGTFGDAGCHSFQNSKNLNSGEGGAILIRDESLYHRAQAFHNNGQGSFPHDGGFTANGGNFRLTEFQGALLLQQLARLEEQSRRREENAAYLDSLLQEIPGVRPKQKLAGTTRHGYHLYVFDYDPDQFAGMNKARFLEAVRAEGIPARGGYSAINRQPWVDSILQSRGFQRIYGAKRLAQWREQNDLPGNDETIERTCWMSQTTLLGERQQMEQIAEGLRRLQRHADQVAQL